MPSLRGTRHDSAKIDGGGSNPPGGTSAGRGSSVLDQMSNRGLARDRPRFEFCPHVFTGRWCLVTDSKPRVRRETHIPSSASCPFYVEVWRPDRTPNPIGLGSIPRRRASSALRRGPPCGVIAAGSDPAFRHGTILRGVAQIGRALGSGPRGRWFKSTHPDASIAHMGAIFLCHHSPGNGPTMEGNRFDSTSMRDT
jgi:hypothetical protein